MSQIFFSPEDFRRGKYHTVQTPIVAVDGRSYELNEWIGRGGNAAVFRCRERSTGDEYAIKFLLNKGRRVSERFARETKLLEQLRHDHIVRYKTSGRVAIREDKRRIIPFLVMEVAECNLSDEMINSNNSIPLERFLGQFRGLAHGLADLHKHAVHRDIKPENILVAGERWLLSDYGLCQFPRTRDPDLTPGSQAPGPKFWMSPEAQNRRLGTEDAICKASDVYQLAAVFWYVATGRYPSGILTRDDWRGPTRLFEPLYGALQHDLRRRPADGAAFAATIDEALTL